MLARHRLSRRQNCSPYIQVWRVRIRGKVTRVEGNRTRNESSRKYSHPLREKYWKRLDANDDGIGIIHVNR